MEITTVKNETAIAVSDISILIAEEHTKNRDALILASQKITEVNEDNLQAVISTGGQIKAILKMVENERKRVKDPVLNLGRAIDAAASNFTDSLKKESNRLDTLAGVYAAKKREEERAEAARKAEEARNAEDERLKAIKEAEEAKRIAEKSLANAGDESDKEKAEIALMEAEIAQEEAFSQPVEVPEEVQKTGIRGASIRPKYDVELLDIKALYEAYPQAVEMTMKKSVVNDLISKGITDIPGVKLTEQVKVNIRATAAISIQ